ncbi:tyrosine-type recombinase/integrase [Halopiger xanaduensis]|uniref:Integrase family protein n=1 Tax=Halopiger xanaduensis (strain DSM 18323 / JCM 14033 / SH-6) TaxID=797210 RepID=F8D8G2_HALXS|nr:tyrosine-type recombinase/integrase [Halopiger xanaduensis]AEH35585.1 integrase family protein [Halopiger xanaduensis SH-6]
MVEARRIPGAAVKPHEPYVEEFGERNAEILSGFRASMKRTQAEGSAQTWISGAVTCARWLEEHYGINLEEANRSDLDDYLEYISGEFESTETLGGKLDSVRHLYDWMYRKGVVDDDPTTAFDWENYVNGKSRTLQAEALNQNKDYVAIPREEVEELWQDDALPSPALRNEILIRLLWYTGMRSSEIVRVKIGDIDRDEGRIRIYAKKTDDYRDVWYPVNRMEPLLNEWLGYRRSALSPYADESPYLLLTHQAEQMRASHVSRIVKDAARNAGINEVLYVDAAGKKRWKVTGHTLRHSFATHHANVLETPIHILQDVMGHDKIETTRKYISEDKEAQRRAMQEPWE